MRIAKLRGCLKMSQPHRLSKNPWESSRGPQPSRITIVASGVYGGHGAIFSEENPIFRRKNRFLADFAAGTRRVPAKSVKGVVAAGEVGPPPPACQKHFFDKLRPLRKRGGLLPAGGIAGKRERSETGGIRPRNDRRN